MFYFKLQLMFTFDAKSINVLYTFSMYIYNSYWFIYTEALNKQGENEIFRIPILSFVQIRIYIYIYTYIDVPLHCNGTNCRSLAHNTIPTMSGRIDVPEIIQFSSSFLSLRLSFNFSSFLNSQFQNS